ncbi:MAG: glycosyltransferase family 39 protein [Verrucomicrobiae bacterium]|nr:glycosyltransferase family 39 protein [Verrucomicrobiae bacterium]
MALTFCCLYLLLMVTLGYFLFSIIDASGRVTVAQLFGLVPALGAGALGLLLFWLSLVGFAPSRILLGAIGFTTLAGLLLLAKFRRLARLNVPLIWTKSDAWCLLPGVMILGAVGLLAAGSLAVPLVDWDAFAIWGFKAKVLAHEALHPAPAYFHDLTLSYSHLDYPLLLPFLTAGAYAAMGAVDDQAGKLVSVFLDVLILPLVYLGLRWKLPRLPSLCLCALLAWLPAFLRFGGTGCADLPLAMFYAGSIFFAARWLDRRQRDDLVLSVLFSAFTAFTKNEGLALALINGLVLLFFSVCSFQKRAWVGAVVFFAGLLVVDGAWIFWSHSLPRTHENYGSKLLSSQLITNLPKLKQIFWAMFFELTNSSLWGWLALMTGALAWLGRRAFLRPPVLAMWLLLGLHLLTYALVYCVTPWNLTMLLATSLDRLLWHALPAVILLAGWHWAEISTPPVILTATIEARSLQ